MDQIMDVRKLALDRRGKDEWVEIAMTHRPIYAVHRKDEWDPGFHDLLGAARRIGIEIDIRLVSSGSVKMGAYGHAK